MVDPGNSAPGEQGNIRRFMNVRQLSEYLGISRWMLYKYVENREIPFAPFGRLVRFDRVEVEKWVSKRMVRAFRPQEDCRQ